MGVDVYCAHYTSNPVTERPVTLPLWTGVGREEGLQAAQGARLAGMHQGTASAAGRRLCGASAQASVRAWASVGTWHFCISAPAGPSTQAAGSVPRAPDLLGLQKYLDLHF